MSTNLKRLIYVSRNVMPGDPAAVRAGIDQILAASRRNNRRAGVTGALLFNRGGFAQILEGQSASVGEVFERIQRDPRHAEVVALELTDLATRSFPSWSTAFVGANRADEQLFAGIAGRSAFDAARLSGEEIFTTLRRLLHEEEDAPAAG
jgi:blue light- and temperature-responsive anti-repressor